MPETTHIGDGVYVSHDGYQIWLETSNGIAVTNRIALEPEVCLRLAEWSRDLYGRFGQSSPFQLPERSDG